MTEEVHNAQLWTMVDKEDEIRTVERDGNFRNVSIRVAKTWEDQIGKAKLKYRRLMTQSQMVKHG